MFRLAGHLGMTVAELGQRMGAGELAEWQALLTVEPYGAWQMDLLAGLIAYSSVATHSKEARWSQFVPNWAEASKASANNGVREVSPTELAGMLQSWGAKIDG
jgi:hypothetical protein